MKDRQILIDHAAKQLQELLELAEPDTAHQVLDVIALYIIGGAKYLAGTASREQAITSLHDMAKFLETARDLPKVNIVSKIGQKPNVTHH